MPECSRDERWRDSAAGALAACALGGVCAWLAVGNLADLIVDTLPVDGSPALAAMRRPFEVVRACRVLATVNGREADLLIRRREIRDVLEASSLDRLLRTPGIFRRMARAAEGDSLALSSLFADPDVKDAMTEPEFLRRVRAVDVVALAEELERIRSNPQFAESAIPDAPLPGIYADDHLRRLVLAELAAEVNAAPPELFDSDPHRPATQEEVTAYWRRVGGIMEFLDGPNVPSLLIPDLRPPSEPPKSATDP